jgi:alkanesulfonate monooxygenase SsuD/methylene tetrahydromethanopterin reductase-like flavin-dependent oxidoreductase (luciferase family)
LAADLGLGLTLPQRGVFFGVTTSAQLIDLARRADADPRFDSVWVGDSVFAKPRPDSISLLGGLATATSRVTLGAACMASFPIRDPLVFAYQWATLDWLSGGRMLVAACTGIVRGGASEVEGRPWGVSDKQRARRMAENIEICRLLWTGEPVSYSGTFRQFENVTVQPKPIQDPCPLWIAANPMAQPQFMDRPLRRVARMADGWMTAQVWPRSFGNLWKRLSEILVEEGKDPATYPNRAYHNVNINEDAAAAYDESKRFLDLYYGPVFNEDMVRAWTALGSPEDCIAQLRELRAAGAKAITVRFTAWDQETQYRRFMEEVFPHL